MTALDSCDPLTDGGQDYKQPSVVPNLFARREQDAPVPEASSHQQKQYSMLPNTLVFKKDEYKKKRKKKTTNNATKSQPLANVHLEEKRKFSPFHGRVNRFTVTLGSLKQATNQQITLQSLCEDKSQISTAPTKKL